MPDQFGNPLPEDLVPPGQVPAGFQAGAFGLPPTPTNTQLFAQANAPLPDLQAQLFALQSQFAPPVPTFAQRFGMGISGLDSGPAKSGLAGFGQGLQASFSKAQELAFQRRQKMMAERSAAASKLATGRWEDAKKSKEDAAQALQNEATWAQHQKYTKFAPIYDPNGNPIGMGTPQASGANQLGIANLKQRKANQAANLDLSAQRLKLAKRRLAQSPFGPTAQEDGATIGEAIKRGLMPPDMLGNRMTQYSQPIWNYLANQGVNLRDMKTAYAATQRAVSSANNPQQLRIRQALPVVLNGLDALSQMNDELTSLIPRSDVKKLDNLSFSAGQNWALYGPRAQYLAQQISSLSASLAPEMANIYMAGNTPTDQANKLAEESVGHRGNMTPNQLRAGIDIARREMNWRKSAIETVGVVTGQVGAYGQAGTTGITGGAPVSYPGANIPAGGGEQPHGKTQRWGRDPKTGKPVRIQ